MCLCLVSYPPLRRRDLLCLPLVSFPPPAPPSAALIIRITQVTILVVDDSVISSRLAIHKLRSLG